MDLLIYTGALDRSSAAATSASDLTALVGPDAFPQLVLGTTEPLTAKFLSAASTYESWSGDATYAVTASLGWLTPDGLQVFAEATLSTAISNGKSGELALTTTALCEALRIALGCRPRATSVEMVLQLTVTDPSGNRRAYAQLPVTVNGRVPNFVPTPANLPSTAYLTAAEIAALYVAKADARYLAANIFIGSLADETLFGYFYAEKATKILGMQLASGVAPVGADVTVDIVNSSSVEQAKIATLAAGSRNQRTIFGSALELAAGDWVRLKVKSIGSTTPGSQLMANLICQPNS